MVWGFPWKALGFVWWTIKCLDHLDTRGVVVSTGMEAKTSVFLPSVPEGDLAESVPGSIWVCIKIRRPPNDPLEEGNLPKPIGWGDTTCERPNERLPQPAPYCVLR